MLDLNDPPTAVGGIPEMSSSALRETKNTGLASAV